MLNTYFKFKNYVNHGNISSYKGEKYLFDIIFDFCYGLDDYKKEK